MRTLAHLGVSTPDGDLAGTNGFDTLLVAGSDLEIASLRQLTTGEVSRTALYRIKGDRLLRLGAAITTVLNQRGDLLPG